MKLCLQYDKTTHSNPKPEAWVAKGKLGQFVHFYLAQLLGHS